MIAVCLYVNEKVKINDRNMIVVLEFRKQKEIIPVILPLVNEESEELFQLLIDSLHLSISLGVICHGGH